MDNNSKESIINLNTNSPEWIKLDFAVRSLQKYYKIKKIRINKINTQLNNMYFLIASSMSRLQTSFKYNLINQYSYNSGMDKLNLIFELFKITPRPFRIYHLQIHEESLSIIRKKLQKIKKMLNEIVENYGMEKIDDISVLYSGKTLNELYSDSPYDKLVQFYNFTFNVISVHCYDLNNIYFDERKNKSNLEKINLSTSPESEIILYRPEKTQNDYYFYDIKNLENINKPKCRPLIKKKITLMEYIQGARLYVPLFYQHTTEEKQVLVMNGYFNEDSLNLSKFGGILGDKEKKLNLLTKNLEIDNKFVEGYLKQLSLRDFILNSSKDIIDKCLIAYNEAKNLSNKPISILIKDFLNYEIEKQRHILIILLLMKDHINYQYLAYILYDMISNENYVKTDQKISEVIISSLHWSVKKLFCVAINQVNKYTQKLTDFNEEELSYEKRICLMKASDSVKGKAMEKYRELMSKGSNDDISKTKQYLDGLLKIPFGIYRKEQIITFLVNYRNEINNFVHFSYEIIKEYEHSQNNPHLVNIALLFKQYYKNIHNKTQTINSYFINNFIDSLKSQSELLLETRIQSFEKLSSTELNQEIIKLCQYLKMNDLRNMIREINDELLKDKSQIEKLPFKGGKKEIYTSLSGFFEKISNLNSRSKYLEKMEKLAQLHYLTIHPSITKVIGQFQHLKNKWLQYKTDYRCYLDNVDQILDRAVYGQEEAKIQIKRILAQWINGESSGYCFGFEGAPGVGKTSLAKKGISLCLLDTDGSSRPFAFIALGGSTNGSTLEGHSYTYVKSTWGNIVQVLMDARCMNPIIYIDELDKVSRTEHGKEIIGILTHLTDPSQNDEYSDKYFSGIKLDLSKVLFIFSYNDYNLIDPILADRIHRVKFTRLSLNEKIKIVNNYLMPELLRTVGFDQNDILIEDQVIEFLIRNYTYEAGVRKLREKLFEIIREINLRYLMDNLEYCLPINISIKLIEDVFSGKPKITIKRIADRSYVGRVNGLFATSMGMGGLTIIEAYRTPTDSKLNLELTGQQGDVMKESMHVAKTVAWNLLPSDKKSQILKSMKDNGNFGIHIHCPEAATPKEGPSAGGAITLAIISLLTNIPIKNMVAITGEIDLNGGIHKIGGLDFKIDGAKNAGVKTVICPRENEEDLEILKEKNDIILDEIEIVMIDNIWDLIDLALEDNDINFVNYIHGDNSNINTPIIDFNESDGDGDCSPV